MHCIASITWKNVSYVSCIFFVHNFLNTKNKDEIKKKKGNKNKKLKISK